MELVSQFQKAFHYGALGSAHHPGAQLRTEVTGRRTSHKLTGRPPPAGGERAFTLSYVFKEHRASEMTPRWGQEEGQEPLC